MTHDTLTKLLLKNEKQSCGYRAQLMCNRVHPPGSDKPYKCIIACYKLRAEIEFVCRTTITNLYKTKKTMETTIRYCIYII